MTEGQDAVDAMQSPDQSNSQSEIQPKLLTEDQVSKIVRERIADVKQKTRKEVMAEMQAQQVAQQPTQQPAQQPDMMNISMGGMTQSLNQPPVNNEMIRQMIQEESQRMTHEALAQRTAQDFLSKVEASKAHYPDIEKEIRSLNLGSFPELVDWANKLDNTVPILREMALNPARYANVMLLAARAPELAQAELMDLSKSISKNQSAKDIPTPPAPLSQIKPSTIGIDSGEMTQKDLDAMFKNKYRG